MNDQYLINNYLLILKSTVEVYVHGTLESSNKNVRKLLQQCLNDTIDMQDKTYHKMVENNWYTVENINVKEISKVYEKVKKKEQC